LHYIRKFSISLIDYKGGTNYISGVGYIVGRANTAFSIKNNISVRYFSTTPVLKMESNPNHESNDSNPSGSEIGIGDIALYDLTGNDSYQIMIRATINEIFSERNININKDIYRLLDLHQHLDKNSIEMLSYVILKRSVKNFKRTLLESSKFEK
jgi:hypothetical protein